MNVEAMTGQDLRRRRTDAEPRHWWHGIPQPLQRQARGRLAHNNDRAITLQRVKHRLLLSRNR